MALAKWKNPFGGPTTTSANSAIAKSHPIPVSSADAKQFGLENFGNTCYANSVLQALYFCSPFRDLVIQSPDSSVIQPDVIQNPSTPIVPATSSQARRHLERKHSIAGHSTDTHSHNGIPQQPTGPLIPSSPPTLFSALRSLFLHISKNTAAKGTVPPRAFIDKLKEVNELFRSTMHQDAHEFLNYLLNKIVEEIEEERKQQPMSDDFSNSIATPPSSSPPTIITATLSSNSGTTSRDTTLVHKLFEGVLTSETRCLTCETVSSRDESFLDLSLDIEQNSSVTACLRQFSASEMLCQKNKFFCDSCCDLQEAEKRMKIKKLPNVLALHLKRFKYQEDVQKFIKLAYRVAFPMELRLFNTVDDAENADRLYELFAIVVHIGVGPHHGHYISIIKTLGNWLVFDDDTVYPIKESEIPKYFGESTAGSAYVLYYQAVDIDFISLGLPLSVSEPVEQPVLLEPAEESSPQPPVPPGLADETDLSDISDPLPPDTPPLQPLPAPLLPPPDKPQRIPTESLSVTVPSTEESSVPPSASPRSPPVSPAIANGELRNTFRSIRHSPSGKLRSGLLLLRPKTSSGSTEGDIGAAAAKAANGKETSKGKEPERKPSGWFRRRSKLDKTRPDTAFETPSSPLLSPRHGDESYSPSSSSSASWVRGAGHSPRQSRDNVDPNASDIDLHTGGSTSVQSSRLVPKPSTEMNGQDGHDQRNSRLSSPGPVVSSFAALTSDSSVDFPRRSVLSTIPGSPSNSRLQPSDHKKSHPQLGSLKFKSTDPLKPKASPRPSTAGAATGRSLIATTSTPPVPPIPLSSVQVQPISNGDALHQGVGLTGKANERPRSAHASMEFASLVNGNSNSTATTSTGTNVKRTSRKLSLTAPFLGFVRKDKDKQKDKEKKDKESHDDTSRRVPPSAFIHSL